MLCTGPHNARDIAKDHGQSRFQRGCADAVLPQIPSYILMPLEMISLSTLSSSPLTGTKTPDAIFNDDRYRDRYTFGYI